MMADERQKQLMQEALDETLSPEVLHEFQKRLDSTPDEAHSFQRLKQVDKLLRSAPMERAPHTLAVNIMAKLAEGIQQRAQGKVSGLALALALALLTAVLMPILVIFAWLILGLLGNAAALGQALTSLTNFLTNVTAMVDSLVSNAQSVLNTYPEAPALVGAVVPVSVYWLWRTSRRHRADERQRSAESRLGDTGTNDPGVPVNKATTAEVRAAESRLQGNASQSRSGDDNK